MEFHVGEFTFHILNNGICVSLTLETIISIMIRFEDVIKLYDAIFEGSMSHSILVFDLSEGIDAKIVPEDKGYNIEFRLSTHESPFIARIEGKNLNEFTHFLRGFLRRVSYEIHWRLADL